MPYEQRDLAQRCNENLRRLTELVALLVLALPAAAVAEERLYVGNTDSGSLSVISVPRLTMASNIRVGLFIPGAVCAPAGHPAGTRCRAQQ